MASPQDFVQEFRRMIDEPTDANYSDDVLVATYLAPTANVEGTPDLESAAGRFWREKAAKYHRLVTTSEAGSSRSLSDLLKNALALAKSYEDKVASRTASAPTTGRTTTRAIERA